MSRAFLLNILFLLFINLLIKPFYIFGIDRTIQNRVGLEDYGLYVTLFSFTLLLQIINDFGIQNFNNRNIAQHNQLLPKYFPNILVLKAGLALVFTFITLLMALMLGYGPRQFHLLSFFILNQILISAVLFFRSNISGLGLYRTDSLLTILDRLLLILICSYLLWGNMAGQNFKIEWFVYTQTFSLIITAIVAFTIVLRRLPFFKLSLNRTFLILIIKKSYPYALAVFLMTIYTRIDFVMIERLLDEGAKESGIYASAYRLLDAANTLGLLFAGLLLPMSARLLKEKKNIRPLLLLSLKLILCIAITVAFATIFYRKEIIFFLYSDASVYAADILGILMLTFIITSATYIYGTLLTANNSLEKLNVVFTISVGMNIFLNFLLIPAYGALGAALTTFFTHALALFYQIKIARKEFVLSKNYNLLLRFIGLALSLIATYFFFEYFLSFNWMTNYLILIVFGGASGLIFNLIKISEWRGILNSD